jgi:glycosyltransferase involved in cell wall biosynthesis
MRLALVVMAYKQEAFIQATVAAALAQDHPGLEIVLSDDALPDATYQIMSSMAASYRGPHRVVLNRNSRNLGLIGHVNSLFRLTEADYLIYNAGDDISEKHRARAVAEVIARDRPMYIHSDVTDLHPDGQPFERQRNRNRADELSAMSIQQLSRAMSHGIGATAVWHRDIFDLFGPITETGIYEDSVLLFRARLIGDVSYIDDRLVRYRRGLGLTAGKGVDKEKEFETSLAVLRQRLADCRSGAPHEGKVIRNLERKLGIRVNRRQGEGGEDSFEDGRPAVSRSLPP